VRLLAMVFSVRGLSLCNWLGQLVPVKFRFFWVLK